MERYECIVCGYVYDEDLGVVDQGIAKGTRFGDLPEDWTCPLCGATKEEFKVQSGKKATKEGNMAQNGPVAYSIEELGAGELSALFSNLAKGCLKQYREVEAGLFGELGEYFENLVTLPEEPGIKDLADSINGDLDLFSSVNAIDEVLKDRGALRALVWGEKVSRIGLSVLGRFEKQGNDLIENTDVHVCEICGFVFIGDRPPEICPVCKVPAIKIAKISKEVA